MLDTDASPLTKTVISPATMIDSLPTPPTPLAGSLLVFTGWWTANGTGGNWGTLFTAATPVMADITVYARWSPEYFKFTIRTTAADKTFAIPTSGQLNGGGTAKPYTWIIDWGDGQSGPASGISLDRTAGIPHTYASADDYQITIAPDLSAGSIDAWFGAFGFNSTNEGANYRTNRDKLISLDSPLTLLMTRTQAQIDGTAPPPTNEWAYTFITCRNPAFTMGADFKFAAEWDAITTVGGGFASWMFEDCEGAAFTMSVGFNLPAGITTVGNGFASYMFDECRGGAFNMSAVFNLPAGITTVGTDFASRMFQSWQSLSFQVNSVFKFPVLSATELNKSNVFYQTLNLSAFAQTRTADSIINGNSAPSARQQTFGPSSVWSDYASIHANWK